MLKAFIMETKLGPIGIAERDGYVTHVFFGNTVTPKEYTLEETPLLRLAATQIEEYFSGVRKTFDLPLQPDGTAFEKSVWEALRAIPYGETRSYGDIAEQIGNPKACRAVGHANSKNPLSIVVPCHRVIGVHGKLTGYAGGLQMKKALLLLERQFA